jgi:hypothetical protein
VHFSKEVRKAVFSCLQASHEEWRGAAATVS